MSQRDLVAEVLSEEFDQQWRLRDVFTETADLWIVVVTFIVIAWGVGFDLELRGIVTLGLWSLASIVTLVTAIASRLGSPYATDPRKFGRNHSVLKKRLAEKRTREDA